MNQRKSLPDNLLQNICEEFNKLLGMQTLNWFRRLTAPIIKIPTGHFAESVEEFTDWDQTKESAPKWGEIGNRKSLTR